MFRVSMIATAIFIFLSGCFDRTEAGTDASRQEQGTAYFDIAGYFEKEAQRLSSRTGFTKRVMMNGEVEESQVERIDFKNDLKAFAKSDINRPAWSDKYEIDSTFNQNKELIKIAYQTNEPKLVTKEITIDFEKGEVAKIHIINGTKSAIALTEQILIYRPSKGYSIESKQDVTTLDENTFRVEVSFE